MSGFNGSDQTRANLTPTMVVPTLLANTLPTRSLGSMQNANFPMDAEGRVYHLGIKRGEVANRILSVGDAERAHVVAKLLDKSPKLFHVRSKRGFEVITGYYRGVPLSIIVTGMGMPMMDFVVREARACLDGKMVIVRFGSCGSTRLSAGKMAVASEGSVCVLRNPDAFLESTDRKAPAYNITSPVKADPVLSDLLLACLTKKLGEDQVSGGLNATCDTFYASQGRQDASFVDKNEDLLDSLAERYPSYISIEMETFQLLHLTQCAAPQNSMVAAATTMVFANRQTNEFINKDQIPELESLAGEAILEALTTYALSGNEIMNTPECVWLKSRD